MSVNSPVVRTSTLGLLVGAVVLLSVWCLDARGADVGIGVRATYDAQGGDWLRMELENRSAEHIRMTNSFLPWGSTFSTLLVAVVATDPVGPALMIERNRAEDNPVGRQITIGPGETVSGSIDLNWQFPKLHDWTARGDVVVFWSYVPRLAGGRQGERVGGLVIVPERTFSDAKERRDP